MHIVKVILPLLRLGVSLAANVAAPALAEGRNGPLMTCDFAGEAVSLVEASGKTTLKVGGLYYPAALIQPGAEGKIGAIFVMLDAGPVMIAVDTRGKDGTHAAQISAAAPGDKGVLTRSTEGTCKETTR
jgi:hypothetical protein